MPRPLVSQPLYNLLSRRVESEYAPPGTRFTKKAYQDRYWHPDLFAAVERLREVADHAGLTVVELALRWVSHRPLTDCVLLGAIAGAAPPYHRPG